MILQEDVCDLSETSRAHGERDRGGDRDRDRGKFET